MSLSVHDVLPKVIKKYPFHSCFRGAEQTGSAVDIESIIKIWLYFGRVALMVH